MRQAPFAALLLAILLSVPLVLGFLEGLHPVLGGLAGFRVPLAVAMGLLGAGLLFTALRREGLMVLVLATGALAVAAAGP